MNEHAMLLAVGTRSHLIARIHQAGYWCTVLLAFMLPFEVTQRPLLHGRFLTLTNLKVLLYAVVALAAVTLVQVLARERTAHTRGYFRQQRVPVLLLTGVLLACVISSLMAREQAAGLKWTFDLALGGVLWLALPIWLKEETAARVARIGLALVGGAVIAGAVGIGEFLLGAGFAHSLTPFKAAPSAVGPYLRLSGTFEYANIAAEFLALSLPFALIACIQALTVPRRRWWLTSMSIAAVDIVIASLLLTNSRGAIIGVLAGTTVIVLQLRKRAMPRIHHPALPIMGAIAGLLLILGAVARSPTQVTSLRVTSENDEGWYNAQYLADLPAKAVAGSQITVPVSVTNMGPLRWSATGRQPYRLGYHWLYPSRRVAVYEGERTALPASIPPGGHLTVRAHIRTPFRPGRYLLVWDLVQEGVVWFSAKGTVPEPISVLITGSHAHEQPQPFPKGRREPTYLPVAPPSPGRIQLWSVAWMMIQSHPFFGVGPDGYRLNYGLFTAPKLSLWDKRIFANSLSLELLADLGVVGGGLFAAFLVAVCWPVLSPVVRGDLLPLWQVAVVGSLVSFLSHGLVDFTLGAHAIFVLFWILCGLATTAAMARGT